MRKKFIDLLKYFLKFFQKKVKDKVKQNNYNKNKLEQKKVSERVFKFRFCVIHVRLFIAAINLVVFSIFHKFYKILKIHIYIGLILIYIYNTFLLSLYKAKEYK